MRTVSSTKLRALRAFLPLLWMALLALPLMAQGEGGEASLRLPDLNSARFLGDRIGGHTLLTFGLVFCVLGMIFGLIIYMRLKNMEVHKSMLEVSELIYETCKTYLATQGKFLILLECFIGVIIDMRLKNMEVHKSMLEVSELIYETCKTYLATQGKFLILLECFIGVIIVFYFGFLQSRPA